MFISTLRLEHYPIWLIFLKGWNHQLVVVSAILVAPYCSVYNNPHAENADDLGENPNMVGHPER